MVKKENVKPRL